MMSELGLEVSARGVAGQLKDVLTGFVIDQLDAAHQAAISAMGLRTLVTATIMNNDQARVRLAQEVLEFADRG